MKPEGSEGFLTERGHHNAMSSAGHRAEYCRRQMVPAHRVLFSILFNLHSLDWGSSQGWLPCRSWDFVRSHGSSAASTGSIINPCPLKRISNWPDNAAAVGRSRFPVLAETCKHTGTSLTGASGRRLRHTALFVCYSSSSKLHDTPSFTGLPGYKCSLVLAFQSTVFPSGRDGITTPPSRHSACLRPRPRIICSLYRTVEGLASGFVLQLDVVMHIPAAPLVPPRCLFPWVHWPTCHCPAPPGLRFDDPCCNPSLRGTDRDTHPSLEDKVPSTRVFYFW